MEQEMYDRKQHLLQQRAEQRKIYESALASYEHVIKHTQDELEEIMRFQQEEESIYLMYAPTQARKLFNHLDDLDKHRVMQHVEYLFDAIRFKNTEGEEICVMDAEDATDIPDKEKPDRIQYDKGVTYFYRREAIAHADKVGKKIPTVDLYKKLIQIMPARQYPRLDADPVAYMQLHRLLGGKYSGFRAGGITQMKRTVGMLWADPKGPNKYALLATHEQGNIELCQNHQMLPLRLVKQ